MSRPRQPTTDWGTEGRHRLEKALTRAVTSVRHSRDSRADDLTEEIREAFES